jgi:hypothetical protein
MIVTTLLEEARLLGYSTVRLDTMLFMTDARELYLKMGFVDTEPFPGEAAGIGVADQARYMARQISPRAALRSTPSSSDAGEAERQPMTT